MCASARDGGDPHRPQECRNPCDAAVGGVHRASGAAQPRTGTRDVAVASGGNEGVIRGESPIGRPCELMMSLD